MYSMSWFDSFAAIISAEANAVELSAIMKFAPPDDFPELLDIGCGTGRTAVGLVAKDYRVTGIDINADAISVARKKVPKATFAVLDQRDIATLDQTFDVAVMLWNSFGFSSRDDDQEILRGIAGVLRAGGKLLIDLYHPGWLARNEHHSVRDARGITIDRWSRDGRSMHSITYADGTSDDIQFNVYFPDEIVLMLRTAGFNAGQPMTWWDADKRADDESARYQIVCSRR